MSILRLAIPSPLRRFFDYLPPLGIDSEALEQLLPGTRVKVSFGRRQVTGYLYQVLPSSELDPDKLKRAEEILDQAPLLPAPIFALCEWAWTYYLHPPGEVFSALFPKRLREGKLHELLGVSAWQLTDRGAGLPKGALSRSPKQALALSMLQQQPMVALTALNQKGVSTSVLRSLRDKGLATNCTLSNSPTAAGCGEPLSPTADQAPTIRALLGALGSFSCHLLEGVTGSGKTEVYLQLIAECLRKGQQALVLIPEIGLTPQTLSRFEQRFDADIAVFHSGLSDAQRYRSWEAARSGAAHIVIGTRSAVFTPLAKLGLIIVDEEHDASYKQQDGFRYSGRDVAVKRGQLENCPVILGSATPSLESIHNAGLGRYEHHQLKARAGIATMPSIKLVDSRNQPAQAGLCESVSEDVKSTLQKGQQVLLFLNRRGYAPTLQCRDCGWISNCDHCDARMTVHRKQHRLRCHHCAASSPLPNQCPQCHSQQLAFLGLGTEQSEEYLQKRFAPFPIYRVDSDSMSGREAMSALVDTINGGEPCILLGTQMLTKGHHFPAVTLVVVVDADAMLFNADFRGEEKMSQLLTQVAGRAGRANEPGSVIVQTQYPDHPALQALTGTTYAEHARELLEQRLNNQLPPAGHMAMFRTDCASAQEGEDFLQRLRRQAEQQMPAGASLIGPLPAPLPRRAGRHRFQLLLSAADRRTLRQCAARLVEAAETLPIKRGLKWSIDIDPQDLF